MYFNFEELLTVFFLRQELVPVDVPMVLLDGKNTQSD